MPPSVRSLHAESVINMQSVPLANVCRSCRHVAFRQRIAARQSLRHASNANLPFTEKLRRKIWGTDNPPGLKDPYGGPSFLERRRMEREKRAKGEDPDAHVQIQLGEQERLVEGRDQSEFEADEDGLAVPRSAEAGPTGEEYTPAETWDGLEHIGHTGDWRDIEPTEADQFTPFLTSAGHSTPSQFLSDLHRAAVEVLALDKPIQDKSFLNIKLDPQTRETFALFRRITELTGERIPDPVISKATTLRSIYIYQLESIKPKPKNLAQVLANKKDLAGLPNVKIMDRRQTPVHKEKEVGRWKVIERELRSRGLPVLGTQAG